MLAHASAAHRSYRTVAPASAILLLLVVGAVAPLRAGDCGLVPMEGATPARAKAAVSFLLGEARRLSEPGTDSALLTMRLPELKLCLSQARRMAVGLQTEDALDILSAIAEAERRLAGETAAATIAPRVDANDACADAITIGDEVRTGSTVGADSDGTSSCAASTDSPDVWFRYVAPRTGRVVFDMLGSDYDTALSLHSSCPGTTDNEIGCNDDAFGLRSFIARDVVEGEELLVRVTGFGSQFGNFRLQASEPGSISGQITTEGSVAPTLPFEVMPWFGTDRGFAIATPTGGEGLYTISDVPPGEYYVSAFSQENFVAELYPDAVCPGANCTLPPDATEVAVTSGNDTPDIDLALGQGGSFSGTVTSSNGSPLQVFLAAYDQVGGQVNFGFSGSDGAYTVNGLPAGTYFARVFAGDYLDQLYDGIPCELGCDPTTGDPIAVTVGADHPGIDFVLQPQEGICVPDQVTLCIDDVPGDRRFQVTIDYSTSQSGGLAGSAAAISLSNLGVGRGGLFWFFDQTNPELLVKVLNGCSINNHYWVFYAAVTNVGFTVTVTDTTNDATWLSTNPDLESAAPIQDTSAFLCD